MYTVDEKMLKQKLLFFFFSTEALTNPNSFAHVPV